MSHKMIEDLPRQARDEIGKLEVERQGVSVQGAMKYFQETNHFVSDRYSQVYECCLTNHNMGWPK